MTSMSLIAPVLGQVFTYLPDEEVCQADSVSSFWRQVARMYIWKVKAEANHCPRPMPSGISYKQFHLLLSPQIFGKQFICDHFGEIENVPAIPDDVVTTAFQNDLYDMAHPLPRYKRFVCVYVPGTMTVTSNHHALLKKSSQGRLIEDPDGETVVAAEMTLNNMGFIVENCHKKAMNLGFATEYCWPEVFRQHGNRRISAHWTFQQKAVVGDRSLLASQGLQVAGLADRVWAEYCFCAASRRGLDPHHAVHTATPVLLAGSSYLPTLWWRQNRLVIEDGAEVGLGPFLGSGMAVEAILLHAVVPS